MAYRPVLKASTEIANIPVYDDVAITWELMGAKEIRVQVEVQNPVNIPVGAYINFKGEPYTVNTVPGVKKDGNNKYLYNAVFESILYKLYDKRLRHLGNRTFQYFGRPSEYALLIVTCINEIDPGWTVGPCDDLDPKPINFSGHTCRTALDVVAEAFGLEWDYAGKVIWFTKQVGVTTTHVFKYGMGNGLYSLSYAYQNDKNIVTRAYGYGSTRNLPDGYRAGATQLMFPEGYLESNVNLYGIKEGDYENEDIYPEVAGVVSDAPAWVEGDVTFKVTDSNLKFNLNDYKSVETPKLSFTTGELQGQNFDILSFNNTTKTYTLKVFVDGNNLSLPNSVFQAAPGDTYTLFDMPLPNELVTAAEAKLKAATLEWLNTNSKPQVLYSLELDPLYARDNNILLSPGDRVTIIDEALGINELIRVSKVVYPTNFPEVITPSTKITVEIANFVPYTLTERVLSDIKDTKLEVKTTISQANYIKRMAEYVKALSGVDYLPPETLIIDPSGYIAANIINADYIIARNIVTGKWRMTASTDNIRMVDSVTNKIIMLFDDDGAYDGEYTSSIPPMDRPDGSPDPNFLYSKVVQINGADVLRYTYARRGPGGTFGTPGEAATSLGRGGITTTDMNGIIKQRKSVDLLTGQGLVRDDVYNGLTYDNIDNNTTGLKQSARFKLITVGGINYVTWEAVNAVEDRMYNPYVVADSGDDGGGVDSPIEDPDLPDNPEEPDEPPVGDPEPTDPPAGSPTTLKAAGFPLGIMVKEGTSSNPLGSMNNSQNATLLQQEAKAIVPENGFKNTVTGYNPLTGAYTTDFSETDQQVIWAKANGIKMHIHAGHWPNHNKQWFYDLENNPNMTTQKWWDLLKIMIQAPLLHLKNNPALDGVAESYDAFNELFRQTAAINSDGQVYNSDPFLRKLGPAYIKQGIRWAKEADPRVKVLVNEYGFEYGSTKVAKMIALANECKAEGVPLDGWGLQYHQTCKISSTDTSATRKNLIALAATAEHIHLSEVALSLRYSPYYASGSPFIYTQEMATLQAQKYRALMRYFLLDIPTSKQLRFTVWGITDGSYMGSDVQEFAMLFNDSWQRKLAYDYMLNEMIQINTPMSI